MTSKRHQITWENVTFNTPKRGKYYQVRFRYNGKQIGIASKLTNKKEADENARPIIREWWVKNAVTEARQAGDPLPLSEAVSQYIRAKEPRWKETNKVVVQRILNGLKEVLSDIPIQEMTTDLFGSKLEELKGASSSKYWANRLSTFRSFFKWCIIMDYLYKDPTAGIEFPSRIHFGTRKKKDCWTDEEFEKVLTELPREYREGLMVLRYSGIDVSDLFALKKEHFRKDAKENLKLIKTREKAKSVAETYDQPINSKIKPLINRRLKKAKQDEDKLFKFSFETPRKFSSAIGKRVRRAFERLELEPKDCKSLRHTFATYHVNRDVPMIQLRKWMGHAPGSRTLEAIYDHAESSAEWMD
jgi:integrase